MRNGRSSTSSNKVRKSLGVIEFPRLGLVRSMRYPVARSRLLMIRFTSGDPFGLDSRGSSRNEPAVPKYQCLANYSRDSLGGCGPAGLMGSRKPTTWFVAPPMLAESKGTHLCLRPAIATPDSWIIPIKSDHATSPFTDCWLCSRPKQRPAFTGSWRCRVSDAVREPRVILLSPRRYQTRPANSPLGRTRSACGYVVPTAAL